MPYNESFIQSCNTGWGCGYVLIPKNHPILVKLLFENDGYFYLQLPNFSEEITLSEWVSNGEFYKIGFDTAHGWNNLENSGINFVEAKALEMQKIIDSYTIDHAKAEVNDYLNSVKSKFDNFFNQLKS